MFVEEYILYNKGPFNKWNKKAWAKIMMMIKWGTNRKKLRHNQHNLILNLKGRKNFKLGTWVFWKWREKIMSPPLPPVHRKDFYCESFSLTA